MRTRLGQNFLTDNSIAEKISKSANIDDANILEIGPGKGILTKYLAKRAKKVLAVEIDLPLANTLAKKYDNTKIIADDILKINLPTLIRENNFQPYKLVANLPYYITSKIIRLFLETKYPPTEMILMVQKEVGERIVAKDGKESILSISVKFYAEPEIIFEVSRESFEPVPGVDSAVIKITRKKIIPDVDIKYFFSLVHAGFAAKRKTLMNNLSAGLHIPKAQLSEILKISSIGSEIRAEKLSVSDWLSLYRRIKDEKKN